MTVFENPPLDAFLRQMGEGILFAQLLIRREDTGFQLRHAGDDSAAIGTLRAVAIPELRELAQTTEAGAFRPLKSAPNLRRGWHACAADATELGTALDHLYPGALADWFAARVDRPPLTHYREFTARQTVMYRITTFADDAFAAQITRACCDARFCLKQRLWTIAPLAPDAAADKSLIPCLEPCAILLEFARNAVRWGQQGELPTHIPPQQAQQWFQALHQPAGNVREADFESPQNPRRLALLLQRSGRD